MTMEAIEMQCPDHGRRRFLKLSTATALGLALPHGLVEAAGAGGPTIAVAHGPDAAAITRAAVEALGGMKAFVSRGDVVVVKPNIGWDRTPEQAANTNPHVLAEVVRMCVEAGARRVKVFDRPVNDPRRCYVQSGIEEAARAAGAEVSHMDERRFRTVRIPGEALKEWPLYVDVLEADAVIGVPIAKHHGLARLTMSMKNWMGVMGGRRNMIHQKLDQALAELAQVIRPKLAVMDAVRVLVENGPQGGSLADVRQLDTVVAGADQVAVDAFGATLFGLAPRDIASVVAGERAGLGTADMGRITVRKIEL